jgi:hypothetical protein
MGMKKTRTNFRVVVWPKPPGDFGVCFIGGQTRDEKESMDLCEEIVTQIRRHVDGVQQPIASWDVIKVCEHCGSKWTEGESSPHNGGCCKQDCEVFDKCEAEQPQ